MLRLSLRFPHTYRAADLLAAADESRRAGQLAAIHSRPVIRLGGGQKSVVGEEVTPAIRLAPDQHALRGVRRQPQVGDVVGNRRRLGRQRVIELAKRTKLLVLNVLRGHS
jgi:hypothetical protein